jgi:hypothetical protein
LVENRQSGPGFQGARSKLYRSEYALITLAILVFFAWRYLHAPGGINILEIVFWAIFPDLAAFIPIGLASKKGVWPAWGSYLYNLFHTIIVWTAIFGIAWIVFRAPHWELLGWLGHITTDRAVGYGLRETEKTVVAESDRATT